MKKAPLLIFVLLTSYFQVIPISWGATDEGYGEGNDNLGQFTDSFENTDNITVMDDVIRNSTLNCIELYYNVSGTKLFENFTSYTEVEPNNRVNVINDTHVAHLAYRDEDSYLYYDYGTDYFDDFTHELIVEADFADDLGIGVVWMVSDTVDDFNGVAGSNGNCLVIYLGPNGANNRIIMYEVFNGAFFGVVIHANLVANTLYYLNVSKYDTDFDVYVYDDAAMTNLIASNSLVLQTDHKLEYIFGCNTYNDGQANFWINTDVYFLWLGQMTGGYETDGYFITDDYLNDTNCNGTSLALMLNSTIPWGTEIQVQFSDDNTTWGDWEGIPLDSNILDGGFESIDLRYLNYTDIYFMFNLSTTDGSVTPRLYQSRLISTIGNSTGGPPAGPSGSGAIGFIMLILICSPIIVLFVWRRKKR